MLVSLIISTRGRSSQLGRLFDTLSAQQHKDIEVIIVDQNDDETLTRYLAAKKTPFPIKHLRTPNEAGLSRGRNAGLAVASGSVVVFPDDDCWYPTNFLAHGLELMTARGADILCGRAANEQGRSINGRFETDACRVTRANVWTTGIEWVAFFKRSALDSVGGYDPSIGIGASTPWQSCEGQDIVLRALGKGLACFYDPSIFGHHAEFDIVGLDGSAHRKGRAYGRGLGHVLRIHNYGLADAFFWLSRPMARAAQSLILGRIGHFKYYCNVTLGRSEGWLDRVWK